MDAPRFRPAPIPRAKRCRQLSRYVIADSHGRLIDVMIRDLSPQGFGAAAVGTPPACNEVVRALLDDGREVWGLVRWVDGNLFGVEFDFGA